MCERRLFSVGNLMLEKLKEYKELITILIFFLGGFVWIYGYFATKTQLRSMKCVLNANVSLLTGQLQGNTLAQNLNKNLELQGALEEKAKSDPSSQKMLNGLKQTAKMIEKQLENANICFLHAPLFHPAMKNVAPIRKELGVKTFFNMLGPLVNPASPSCQLIGVFSLKLVRLYGYLHQHLDKRYAIIHSLDGYDEISLTNDIKMITNQGERIISPKEMGFKKINPEAISGGDTVEEAAVIFEAVLSGNGTDCSCLSGPGDCTLYTGADARSVSDWRWVRNGLHVHCHDGRRNCAS